MEKQILFDRETRDFAIYVDGQLIGWRGSRHEAEQLADETVYAWLTHPLSTKLSSI